MSKLQEIKDQVAREYGWSRYASSCGRRDFTEEIARRYAKAVAEDALKWAAERARIAVIVPKSMEPELEDLKDGDDLDIMVDPERLEGCKFRVSRESILSTPINTDL